jgi:hypothetical protein
MDELYPAHAITLKKSNLVPDTFSALVEILDNQQMDPAVTETRKKRRTNKTCELHDYI